MFGCDWWILTVSLYQRNEFISWNNNNRFTALCPWLPGWAGTRRNIQPPTILIFVQSLSASIYHDP